jgi:hypothetical protein
LIDCLLAFAKSADMLNQAVRRIWLPNPLAMDLLVQ